MTDAVIADRIQFAFTLMFHYLFPILTMGLAPLIVVLKTLHLLRRDEKYAEAARFWIRIFALNFAVGVVTCHERPLMRLLLWSRGGEIGDELRQLTDMFPPSPCRMRGSEDGCGDGSSGGHITRRAVQERG
jgi:hypothetical protein